MQALDVALRHYAVQAKLSKDVRDEIRKLWRQVDRGNISRSWTSLAIQALLLLVAAQRTAAGSADAYVNAILAAQNIDNASQGAVSAEQLSGIASDGRALDTLLYQPVFTAKEALAKGISEPRAMAAGLVHLEAIIGTQIADAGRVAAGVALTSRKQATGYVRMVVGKTCSRCIVLAGRWYRWSAGFQRHPRCDCVHIPSRENLAGDLRTDPDQAFKAMSRAGQDKVFTAAGAQAIRDGADISQVVNARRGVTTASVGGRRVLTTTEGVSRSGLAGQRLQGRMRLMPEQIYQIAKSRDEALRLLRSHGYLL